MAPSSLAVVRLAADTGDPSLIDPVFAALDAPATASAAEDSLVILCERLAGLPRGSSGISSSWPCAADGPLDWGSDDVARFHAALASLCTRFADHRRPGVAAAALTLLTPGLLASDSPLAAWFHDESQPGRPSLRASVRRGLTPLSRRRAWEWLSLRSLAPVAIERLARAESTGDHESILSAGHLIESPARAQRWLRGTVKLPSAEIVPSLSTESRRALPRLAADPVVLAPLFTDPDPLTRLNAVGSLPAPEVLDYAFDAEEPIALFAALKWALHDVPEAERERVRANLERSPHPRLRLLSGLENQVPTDIDRLRHELRAGSPTDRLNAIRSLRLRGMQRSLELDLLCLLTSSPTDDPRSHAAAITALAESRTPAALSAVTACLTHTIPRLRANAAESLARNALGRGDLPACEPRLYASLIEMKSDPSHRVRSSALCSILRAASPEFGGTGYEPTAVEELSRMLEDDRAMHRLAGLWALEHAAPGESLFRRHAHLSGLVARLALEDTDDAVQRRSTWCARRMLITTPGLDQLRSVVESAA